MPSESSGPSLPPPLLAATFAALALPPVFLEPVPLPEPWLSHRESDLRLAGRALVQRDRDDPCTHLVPDPDVALRVLPDEALVLLVDVDAIIHDLRDVQKAVERTEAEERAELHD